MLIDFETAYKAMLPYFDPIWRAVNGSWKDWHDEVSPRARALASSGGRAYMVNDFMRARARRMAEEDLTVTAIIRKQMFVLVFAPPDFPGCIGVRFKKLDMDGLSKNQPTDQVKEYRDQLMLPGVDADYHLEAGYVLDRFGSAITSIDLVCPSGEGTYWKAEIIPNNAAQSVASLFTNEGEQGMKEVKVRKKSDQAAGDDDAGTGAR